MIEQSEVSIEVERVLNDLYPFLRTVQPAELNYTLTAIADALEGRGEAIGNNLVVLDGYLQRTNPQLPELVEDLRLLSEVSDVYRSAVPEIARTLRNSVTTGATFIEKEQKIKSLFEDVASLSSTSKDFLEQNGENIIRLGELGAAQLPVFAKYAPEYPCLLGGIVGIGPMQAEAFRGYTLHINLETLRKQPRGYGTRTRRCTATGAARPATTCRTRRGPRTTSRRTRWCPTSSTASTSRPASSGWLPRSTSPPASRAPPPSAAW